MSFRRFLPLAAAAGLAGCLLGPWNMQVDSQKAPITLNVSCMLVAGRPYDSLWLERPLSLDQQYDSARAFVAADSTRIFVVREGSPADTVYYRMDSLDTRIWRPVKTDTVGVGAHYTLHAFVRWNNAREFPADTSFADDTLTAATYTQGYYSLREPVEVPLEALHPALATGLPLAVEQKALQDTGDLAALYDSLNAIKPWAPLGVTVADFQRYLQGYLVLRPVADGDSVYFIFDPTAAPNPDAGSGGILQHFARSWHFAQNYDAADYGGLVVVMGWDTTRARIESPLRKEFEQSLSQTKIDSASLYQPENSSVAEILTRGGMQVANYPDTVAISNLALGYTGRNTFYFYAVDSNYANAHYRDVVAPGIGGGGGGNAGQSGNVIEPTNVQGGAGYFSAAVVDSLSVQVMALSPDTFSVPALHKVWLRQKLNNSGG